MDIRTRIIKVMEFDVDIFRDQYTALREARDAGYEFSYHLLCELDAVSLQVASRPFDVPLTLFGLSENDVVSLRSILDE